MKSILSSIKLMAFVIFLFVPFFVSATDLVANFSLCAHPQICNLLSELPHHKNIQTAVVIAGDHHHFDPKPSDIKKLITANELYHGPLALHPWMKTIMKQRSLNNAVKNYGLTISPELKKQFPGASEEALSHFWLYGKIACQMLQQLENQMSIKSVFKCTEEYQKLETQLKVYFEKNKTTIVLTHDALEPLFKSLGADIISLKGSGHHEEISPSAIKKLYNQTKDKKLTWILETGFDIPSSVRNKIQNKDRVLKVDTMGSPQQKITFVLENLLQQLQNTK